MLQFLLVGILLLGSPFSKGTLASAKSVSVQAVDPVVSGELRNEIVSFARTLTGIRYRYASASPKHGFDCSGFINYVFRKFDIVVPRSSAAFARAGKEVRLENLLPGDLILFTGTNPQIRNIGHIGMVVSEPGEPLRFIHSSSGKAYGVTETGLNEKYRRRYMKAIRIIASAQS